MHHSPGNLSGKMPVLQRKGEQEKVKLYELTDAYQALLDAAESGDVCEEELISTAKQIDEAIEAKAEGIAKILAEMKTHIAGAEAEIERLTNLKRTWVNNVNSLKDYLQYSMLLTGKTKFKTDLFSFSIQKNPPSVVIDDEKAIPAVFWEPQPPKLNKAALKEALSTGEVLDFAHLEQKQSLRIK